MSTLRNIWQMNSIAAMAWPMGSDRTEHDGHVLSGRETEATRQLGMWAWNEGLKWCQTKGRRFAKKWTGSILSCYCLYLVFPMKGRSSRDFKELGSIRASWALQTALIRTWMTIWPAPERRIKGELTMCPTSGQGRLPIQNPLNWWSKEKKQLRAD